MLGSDFYVPILRSKEGEMYALRNLKPREKEKVAPLVEITPNVFLPARSGKYKGCEPIPSEVLFQQAKKLYGSWHYGIFFLDLSLIDGTVSFPGKRHPLDLIAKNLRDWKLRMIPVTGLTRSGAYQEAASRAVKTDGRGICIRVTPDEILSRTFHKSLAVLRQTLQVGEADTDLLVDYATFQDDSPQLEALLARVPQLRRWRSLIVASGAFPKDLQEFRPGIHKIPRNDWLRWRREIASKKLPRKPIFSDYTIQYGKYTEPVDNCNPSASIRYTLDDAWLIMRGEAIKTKKGKEKGPGSAQWPAYATLLLEREEFCGSDFSAGDAYISAMSKQNGKSNGNPMTWIRAGLNHHITLVSRQIASLHAS